MTKGSTMKEMLHISMKNYKFNKLATSNNKPKEFEQIYNQMRQSGLRIEKDFRNEKLNYKIREAQVAKIPYMLIIGDKEKQDGTVTVRLRDGKNLPPMPVADFIKKVEEECQEGRGI